MFELIPFTHTHNVDTYHPFRDLDELERSFFSGSNSLGGFRTDIKDTGDAIVLEADLPGVKKEDIHAKFEDGVLHIQLPAPQQTKALPENPNLIEIE